MKSINIVLAVLVICVIFVAYKVYQQAQKAITTPAVPVSSETSLDDLSQDRGGGISFIGRVNNDGKLGVGTIRRESDNQGTGNARTLFGGTPTGAPDAYTEQFKLL